MPLTASTWVAASAAALPQPQAIKAPARQLLQPPFADRLFLYDFFSECAAFVKTPADFAALAQHVTVIADRVALIDALATADAATPPA